MNNIDIRLMVSEIGLRYRDIASHLGITPEYLCRLMKHELSARNRARIIDAVQELKSKGTDKHGC